MFTAQGSSWGHARLFIRGLSHLESFPAHSPAALSLLSQLTPGEPTLYHVLADRGKLRWGCGAAQEMDWSAAGLDLNRSLDEILNLAEWDGQRQLTFEQFWLLVRRRRDRGRLSSPIHACTRVLCYLAAPRSRSCGFGRASV